MRTISEELNKYFRDCRVKFIILIAEDIETPPSGFKFFKTPHVTNMVVFGREYPLNGIDAPLTLHEDVMNLVSSCNHYNKWLTMVDEDGVFMRESVGQERLILNTNEAEEKPKALFDVYKNLRTEENYRKFLGSGMFWSCYPELTGDWEIDKLVIK